MVLCEEALKIILENTKEGSFEVVSLENALSRVLYEDIYSKEDKPSFDNAAMDGYALNIESLESLPARLKVIGVINAGDEPVEIKKGETVKIFTGAKLPKSANAIIELEKVRQEGDFIVVEEKIKEGTNIRKQGEELKKEDVLLRKGHLIRHYEIGILASNQNAFIKVYRTPTVGVFSTGSELRELCEEEKKNSIIGINHHSIVSACKKAGTNVKNLGIIEDDKDSILEALKRIEEFDVLISTGGASQGDKDLIKELVKEVGIDIKFNQVAVKPGKPMIFGTYKEKLFFGLSGNVVSCLTSFDILVYPALRKLMGIKDPVRPIMLAKLAKDIIRKSSDRREFLKGILTVEHTLLCEPVQKQGSHMISSYSEANCYIVIPKGVKEIKEGQIVEVIPFLNYGY